MTKKLGFGIIGCGAIASFHALSIEDIENITIEGVTDVNVKALEAFADKHNTKSFPSIEALLKCPTVDVVCICTPSGLHAPQAIQAAEAGKHIIIEKPMALTLNDANAIIEATEKNGVKVEVIVQLRLNDYVQEIKRAVDAGELGKIVTGDIYMKYHRSKEYYASSAWRGTIAMDGGGALMNQGIHGIDLASYIMGPVKSVFANYRTLIHDIEVEDTLSALLEYESGAIGVVQATTSIFPGTPKRFEINGFDGSITFEGDGIKSWEMRDGSKPKIDIDKITGNTGFADPMNFDYKWHRKQIQDMVDAVVNDTRPLVNQYDGRVPVEIICAIYESAKTRKIVYL